MNYIIKDVVGITIIVVFMAIVLALLIDYDITLHFCNKLSITNEEFDKCFNGWWYK